MRNLQTNIIDCTFRDGGYYNNWFFPKDLANKYLNSLSECGIHYIEIGYRRINQTSFLGPFAYCKESYLKTLQIPKKSKLGVMINIEDFKSHKKISELIHENFIQEKKSHISFVRIATKFEDIDLALELSSHLKKMGYTSFVNLMQVSSLTEKDFSVIKKKLNASNKPEVFYFADTFGNLDFDKILVLIKLMHNYLDGQIGFHAHNNTGNALNNSLFAMNNGANWIDSTLLGMGRGAGNTRTEYMLINLERDKKYKSAPIYPLLLEDFEPLKEIYRWGDNILYYLSALHNIHPSYIQELLSQDHFKTYQILDAIDYLKKANYSNYSKVNLNNAIFSYPNNSAGSCQPQKIVRNKSVLILANGPSLNIYKNDILNYIKEKSPIVLSLNINRFIDEKYIDAYVSCHPSKILLELKELKNLKKMIIMPIKSIPTNVSKQFKNNIINYGIAIKDNSFRIKKDSCTLPAPLVLGYALAFCNSGLAKNIYLAGFDGYESFDPRQHQINNVIKYFTNLKRKVEIKLITPSNYDAPKQSLYSL